jgi:ABC-type branched-subunit amino acid transport system permease subunit
VGAQVGESGLALGPVAEELKALWLSWDATTQKGVEETIAKPKYAFRSCDNECEAIMASLLTIKNYYALGLLVVAALVMWRIVHSPFGLCLRSIRENPEKAEYVGVSVRRHRFYAFLIAAVFGAVGGALLAVPTGLADPLLAYWTHSGNLVFMVILRGFAHFFGPLLGTFVFIFLQDQVMSITAYWRFVFGAVLAAVVIFFPRGSWASSIRAGQSSDAPQGGLMLRRDV